METEKREVAIEVRGLRKRYRLGRIGGGTLQGVLRDRRDARRSGVPAAEGGSFYALNGIDLTVYKGEALGIIGRNGAGKSTLLKILSRITAPTEGEITLNGRVASMLEVGTGFHGEMTGRENIYLNGAILGMSRAEIDRKLPEILAFSELERFIDTPVKRYSSGMYVKLGFSVAAHLDSEIMIMDEVLAVGDMQFQHKCLDRMRALVREQGRTVLYVSHNMSSVRRLCDRCVVLDEGRIVYDGDPDTAAAIYLGAGQVLGTRYVFSDAYRPYDQWLRLNRRLNLDTLEILASEAVFDADARPELLLTCTAEQPLHRVGLRLELWAQDGVKAGTMLAGNFADLAPGANTLRLRLDLRHLVPGQYRADLVAYLFDEDGNEDILDGVYPGLSFRVTRPLDRDNYLDWHHQYWGNVRLHDLMLLPDGADGRGTT